MSQAQHTPGPWFVTGWNDFGVSTKNAVINDNGDIGEATIVLMTGGSYKTTKEELQANARLIAAAPELLEVAKSAENWLSEYEIGPDSGTQSLLAALRAAIAKATNENA